MTPRGLDDPTRAAALSRIEALARPDKWFLSAGEGSIWAPPFPEWLDHPGFWDTAHVFHYPVGPLFTVALVSGDGSAARLHRGESQWRPDRLRVRWRSDEGLEFTEFRYVLPGGRFCSAWRTEVEMGWLNPAFRDRSLVAFTAAPGEDVRDVEGDGHAVAWRVSSTDRKGGRLTLRMRLTSAILPPRGHHAAGARASEQAALTADGVRCGALRSEGIARPEWALTPFGECWAKPPGEGGGQAEAPGLGTLAGVSGTGWVHLALDVPLGGVPVRHGVAFVLSVVPDIAPGAQQRFSSPRPATATALWQDMFASYPCFECSDPHLAHYFDYRIYGLHLNRIAGGRGNIAHPAIAEGIEYFHLPITYSAQCHMLETRWCADPSTARGSLLNFLANQRVDGSLPGRIYVNHHTGEDFYHANWGDAVLAVDALHPDRDFLAVAYRGLSRYAEWLDRERDSEGSGMITVVNHYETGQEYMSRYLAVDPASDVTEWEPRLRLKGIDVTVYAYQLKRALAALARRLGRADEAPHWEEGAARTGEALLTRMWDDRTGMFSDVDGRTGRRTGVKAAVCFYPLLTDLLTDDHVARMLRHLRNPAEFATPFPVPSSSVDDPLFSAEGLWKGKRHNCPWNGRVWPMTNSHVVEGLLRQWHRGRMEAGTLAAHTLRQFVHMMFRDGDLQRPDCYEHYNPFTGRPSLFRGIDDYQHSWVLDLLVRGAAGLEPTADGVTFHPLPMELDRVDLTGTLRGRPVRVEIRRSHGTLEMAGDTWTAEPGAPVEVPW